MLPHRFKRPSLRKPDQPYMPNRICKHSILRLKEDNIISHFLEQEIIQLKKTYVCVDCQESFQAIPNRMKMIDNELITSNFPNNFV